MHRHRYIWREERIRMYVVLFILCGIESIYDIKTKRIHSLAWGLTGFICMIWNITRNEKDFLWICLSSLVGIFLMICSKLFKGSIGIGDGVVFLTLGLGLGIESTSNILFYSLLLCFIWGMVQVIRKKYSRRAELPFLPFIFLAMIWNFIMILL